LGTTCIDVLALKQAILALKMGQFKHLPYKPFDVLFKFPTFFYDVPVATMFPLPRCSRLQSYLIRSYQPLPFTGVETNIWILKNNIWVRSLFNIASSCRINIADIRIMPTLNLVDIPVDPELRVA